MSVRRGRANRGWRAAVFAEAESLRAEVVLAQRERHYRVDLSGNEPRVVPEGALETDATIAAMVLDFVADAETYGNQRSYPWRWLSGSHNEGAWTSLHAAEALLVELMSPARVASFTAQAAETCRKALAQNDPQRVAVERIAAAVATTPQRRLGDVDRGVLRDALRDAHARNEKRYQRARTVRNGTLAIAVFLLLLVVTAIVVGARRPTALPMCLESDAPSNPATYVCPTGGTIPKGGDIALVAATGVVAAAISAARALSGTTRRVGPYSSTSAQAALKIVLGALLAVVGVTLLRARWVPGVDDVDTGAEILAWALLFGYAQQVLTGLLDQRAEAALAPPDTEGDPAPLPPVGSDPEPEPEPEPPSPPDAEAEEPPAEEPLDESAAAGAEGDVPPESAVVPDVPPDQPGDAPTKPARSARSGGPAKPAARRRGAGQGG